MTQLKFLALLVTAGLTALLFASTASAGVEFVEVQVTTVSIPSRASSALRLQVSDDGDVAAVTAGAGSAHFIKIDLGVGGTETPYLFQGGPVEPFAATFGPGNDIIFRSVVSGDVPVGLTTRMTLDGELVWEQSDEAFFDDAEYLGVYQGPAAPMAWSPTAQRVILFTESSFEVGPVSQASLLFEFNGDVRVPSITFGSEYVGATLANVLTMPSGDFFIYYFSQNDVGARFFIYDGISSIESWEPEGGNWAERVVYLVEYDSAGNLILLWNDLVDAADGSQAHLTKLDPDGRILWESDLSGSIEVEVDGLSQRADMEVPRFMVAGDDEILLLRVIGQAFYFDVRSSTDGSPLGFFDFSALTDNDVYDLVFLDGSDRNYLLSTVNPDAELAPDQSPDNEVLQVQLVLNGDPVEVLPNTNNPVAPTNNGETNNGPIEPPPTPVDPAVPRPSIGCGCVTPPSAPVSDVWGLFGAALLLGLSSRRLRR